MKQPNIGLICSYLSTAIELFNYLYMPPLFFEISTEPEFIGTMQNYNNEEFSTDEVKRLGIKYSNLVFTLSDTNHDLLKIFSAGVLRFTVIKRSDYWFFVFRYPKNGVGAQYFKCDTIKGLNEYLDSL